MKVSHMVQGDKVVIEVEMTKQEAIQAYGMSPWDRVSGMRDMIEDAIAEHCYGQFDDEETKEAYNAMRKEQTSRRNSND